MLWKATCFTIVSCLILIPANLAAASEGGSEYEIVKVEETWELTVGQPNTARNAPQVTMVMSPFAQLNDRYFVFTLNHKNSPDYHAGGMQVVLFDGEEVSDYRNGPSQGPLSNTSETVQWTQTLSIDGGTVTFDVNTGSSTTWGPFGGEGYLRESITTSLSNLNGYQPQNSLNQSEIGFAGNRVVSLRLMKIKWYMADGQEYQVTAPIDIDSDLDPWTDE